MGIVLIKDTEVATTLGIAVDATLTRIVGAVDRWAKDYCGRTFERKSRSIYVRGWGNDTLWLREAPIFGITEVRIDPFGVLDPSSAIADLTQFWFNPIVEEDDDRLHYLIGWFPEGNRTSYVTFDAGYYQFDDGTSGHDIKVPEDIREELIREAIRRYTTRDSSGLKSESIGAYSYTAFDAGVDPVAKAVLRRYKK